MEMITKEIQAELDKLDKEEKLYAVKKAFYNLDKEMKMIKKAFDKMDIEFEAYKAKVKVFEETIKNAVFIVNVLVEDTAAFENAWQEMTIGYFSSQDKAREVFEYYKEHVDEFNSGCDRADTLSLIEYRLDMGVGHIGEGRVVLDEYVYPDED